VVSCHKFSIYEKLLSIYPKLNACQIVGDIKEFNGKKKLAWHFQFTKSQFELLYPSLNEYQLIAFEQSVMLDSIFNKTKILTPLFDDEISNRQRREPETIASRSTPLVHQLSYFSR
ncbi:MAG TPA: hypothetical protein PLD88_06005, partial [Candidatus Berkiella sp.]|nr:hypothetical protein [Candidatus Berkiella sp.]